MCQDFTRDTEKDEKKQTSLSLRYRGYRRMAGIVVVAAQSVALLYNVVRVWTRLAALLTLSCPVVEC